VVDGPWALLSMIDVSQDIGDNSGKVTGVDGRGSSRADVNISFNDEYNPPRNRTLEERVATLERYMYEDERSGEPGLLRTQRMQKWQSQLNSYLLIVVILMHVVQMFFR